VRHDDDGDDDDDDDDDDGDGDHGHHNYHPSMSLDGSAEAGGDYAPVDELLVPGGWAFLSCSPS
jgi:hypothetical protein